MPSWMRANEVQVSKERFKLGSLDTMLQALDKINRSENFSDNILKRVEKAFGELEPDKSLYVLNVESRDKGMISI